MSKVISIFTDGGARGNPGPAAIGVAVECGGKPISTISKTIGVATNNQAEYRALREALNYIFESGLLENELIILNFYLDSELVVRQIKGEYRVKDSGLKVLFDEVVEGLKRLDVPYAFNHIRREQNKVADGLVNKALDDSTPSCPR